MKFSLTLHLQAAVLEIESERLDDLAKGYMMARELANVGHLPAGYDLAAPGEPLGPDADTRPAVDEGVVREASQPPIGPVTPTIERETDKPGKKPRQSKEFKAAVSRVLADNPDVKTDAAAAEVVSDTPPAEPEAPKADKVPREVAQAKLGDLLRDKGTEPVAALLKKFGATRFGLYVADDYAEFCAAIDEAAK